MKKALKTAILLLFPAALALWAAEVWQAKPYTEWGDKDIQKIMTDSPWAKKVSVALPLAGAFGGGPTPPSTGGGGGGGRGGGGGGRGGGPQGTAAGGGGDPGIAGDGEIGGGGGGSVPETQLVIRWRTALVVNEALAKAKYGAEAGTSPEAKKMLEPEPKYYVIWVNGLPASFRPRDAESKQAMMKDSVLNPKDKNSIPAEDIQFAGQGRATDFFYLFPKSAGLAPDDKEVEFVTKLGKTVIKAKFKLKDMEINGKLDL
jgi:hypothetical protein